LIKIKAKMKPEEKVYRDIVLLPFPKNENAVYAAYDVFKATKPDVVLTIGDYWDFYFMQAVKAKLDFAFKWFGYFTVEQGAIPRKSAPMFRYVDKIAVPSEFGKGTLEESAGCRDVVFLPYGTDAVFGRRDDLRRPPDGKVRFVTVAQNTPRKNLPVIVQAARILKDAGDDRATFHVHTNISAYDPCETYSYDLPLLAERLGVSDRVSFPGKKDNVSVFSAPGPEALLAEYNRSDYYLSTATTEGYGLPVVEAMACGLPALANASSSLFELLGAPRGALGRAPRGWLSRGRMDVCPPADLIRVADPGVLAEDVRRLCDGEIKKEVGAECEKYAKGRTWEGMKAGLRELFSEGSGKEVVLPIEEMT